MDLYKSTSFSTLIKSVKCLFSFGNDRLNRRVDESRLCIFINNEVLVRICSKSNLLICKKKNGMHIKIVGRWFPQA